MPRLGRLGRAGRAWVALLLVAAAAVPVAAARAPGGAAAVRVAAPQQPPTPVASAIPEPVPDLITSEQSGVLIDWRPSRAEGSPNGGRLVDGVRLPASGTGFYTYDPRTQQPPGGLGTRWGTAGTIQEILEVGRWWASAHPDEPPLGIGDISREDGGPIDGHASHQNGLDFDVRLPRRDDVIGAADPSNYDRDLTQAVINRLVDQGASLVLVGPGLDVYGPPGVVVDWPNHDDHLHVRFGGAGGGD
jgi:hypothetical protein